MSTLAGFTFDRDLATAATIPSTWYRDPAILQREQDRIFAKTWQLVGHSEQVALPGDYFTCVVADEPLVVTRGDDGALHAFSNVCRHRAGPVARGAGHRKALMCGYHGWTYSLEGKLLTTPEWEGVRCFEKERQNLPAARVETWGTFLFVCLDPATPPLAEVLGSIPKETSHLPLTRMSLFKKVDYEVACNWKLLAENAMEAYHTGTVHGGSLGQQTGEQVRTRGHWDALFIAQETSIAVLPGEAAPFACGVAKSPSSSVVFGVRRGTRSLLEGP